MKLTDVIFTFYTPQGVPVGETDFTIQLVRPGYDKQVGVIQGETLYLKTNSDGTAVVSLAPSNSPYYVKVDGPDFCSQISYKFFVIESDVPVNFQELIDRGQLNPVDLTEETIRLIIEARIQSAQSAAEAKVSELAAKASEDAALVSETNAAASEVASKAAQMASQGNADSALASKNAAKISETNSKTSETNAKASETAAKASQTAAKTSETIAKTSETNATAAAFNATTEAGKAAASATAAKTSETNAKANETNTSAMKNWVEQTAAQVQEIKNDTEVLYNQALAIGSGWSPVLKAIMDGSRAILQITDWTGGRGTKPAVGYVGPNGVVATTANALDIRGAKGVDGKSFTVNATGTLAGRDAYNNQPEGFAYLATDNGMLYLRQGAAGNWSPGIPFGKGDKGDQGDTGERGPVGPAGPANKLTIGTVTTSTTSSATITGTAPNQILNLTLQKGDKGDKGDTGLGFTQAQYDKLDGIEAGAQKNVPTNLSMGIANATTQTVLSSTGTSAVIPQATITAAGLLSATDKVKLNGAAPLASPTFTGTVNAPTPSNSSDSTIVATTAFVRSAMKVNGFSDIFSQNVRYINSSGTAVAPWNDCNTLPPGSQALVANNFVANCPEGDYLWYIETKANYRANAGLWQIAQGYQQGYIWHRWATASNVYGAWRQMMATDGANMTGQLGVLNQTAENSSTRAANTAFVHGAMDFYGVSVAYVEAQSEPRLTVAGQPATNDFNLMVGATAGGTYTIAGSYLNGPNGAAATSYTAVLHIVRSKHNAGPAVIQWFYSTEQGGGIVTVFVRSGAFVSNAWTFGVWRKLAFETSNVASATKLQTAQSFSLTGGAVAAAKSFDGTGAVVLDVTALDVSKATAGALPVARGGTGATATTGTGSNVLSANPAFTGNPTATTQAATDNSTRLATTAFVKLAVENPLGAVDQRVGADNTYQRLWSVGWSGKGASWLWEMTAAGNFNLVQYNKDTGNAVAQVASFKPGGEVYFPGYINSRLDSWYTNVPAVTQKGNIGGAFANWTMEAVPALQVDCPDKLAAYMIWRGTRWGGQHLAAMHVHETNAQNPMVTLSLAGGNYQHEWRKDNYNVSGTVSANGVVLTSDIRIKDIHGGVSGALDKLAKISKVFFSYKGKTDKQFGYTAQSVEAVLPEAVSERDAKPHEQKYVGDKVKVVDYNAVAVLQAQAIDELHALVKKQQAQIDSLMAALATR